MLEKNTYSLRKFKSNDALDLFNALSDKRVVRHMASEGITFDVCKQIISESLEHWDKYNIGAYAVIDLKTDLIIGWAGFKFWKEGEFEIVIVLSPKIWGLGSLICDDLLIQAKEKFSLNKIFILLPETRKSYRWVQSKGFKFNCNEVFNGESFKKFDKEL